MRFITACIYVTLFIVQLPCYAKPGRVTPHGYSNENEATLLPVELGKYDEDAPPSTICGTSTFYMRLSDKNGSKIQLHEVQGFVEGGFVAAGELIGSTGSQGVIVRLDNAGNILTQQILQVNGNAVSIHSVRINLKGDITFTGTIAANTNDVFVVQYANNFALNWVKVLRISSQPLKLTLSSSSEEKFALAIQSNTAVVCAQLDKNGEADWKREIKFNEPVNVLGFGGQIGNLSLVTQHVRAGKNETQFATMGIDGVVLSTNIIGDGSSEYKGLDISTHSFRSLMLSIVKNNSSAYHVVRNIFYNSGNIETEQVYDIEGANDFNTSAAMDNAGDVMGICNPSSGKLIFLKQFAYYQILPEQCKRYDVPVGSSIFSVTRASDGGYLLGLNTSLSTDVVFIKTDSVGILAGCGYKDLSASLAETFNIPTRQASSTNNDAVVAISTAAAQLKPVNLAPTFNCNETYCHEVPEEDTCQATYFKILRSKSYSDGFGLYGLMRGNRHLIQTFRQDRILEQTEYIKLGLKLFEESGHFIKGITLDEGGPSTISCIKQFNDSSIMVCFQIFIDNVPHFTFRLFSDDLKLLWTRTVKAGADFNMYSGGSVIGDIHQDAEGNYYMVGTTLGYMEDPKIMMYKMDNTGNPIWVKIHTIGGGLNFGNISMTSTANSLVVVAEGGGRGSASASFDMSTGQLLKVYRFSNSGGGSLYNRLLKYSKGRIFYAGSAASEFAMGLFDTTGKPYKFQLILTGDICRASDVKDGYLYATFMNIPNHVVVKADTALQITSAYEYERTDYPNALKVSPQGNVYAVGNITNQYEYSPFIKKYDANGKIGFCGKPVTLNVADIQLNTTELSSMPFPYPIFTVVGDPYLKILPDTIGQEIGASLCSSNPLCKSIKLSGPTSVCQLNTDYTFKHIRNAGCNLTPMFTVDTSLVNLVSTTDTTIIVQFRKTGTARLLASINAGCSFYSDSVFVKIQDGKNFSLGADKEICKGDTIMLDAGTGFSTYTWQDGSGKPKFTVTKAGIYYVKVTNNCNEFFYDTVQITEAIIPNLYLGNDTTICKLDTLYLNVQTGFATYLWSPSAAVTGTGAKVFMQVENNQQVTLKATTHKGCSAYDTLLVNLKEARPLALGSDTSFCLNDSVKADAGGGYSKYIWSTGQTSSAITVSNAGPYSVAATDVNGCIAKDTFTVIQVYPLPIVNLGMDFSLCIGEQKQLDAGNFVSYLWQNNSTARYLTVNTEGIYQVSVIDKNNCEGSDEIELKKVFALPANFLAGPDSICSYEKIDLKAPAGFHNFKWSTGSTQPTITVERAGNYWLTARDNNGCEGRDTITVFPKECIVGLFIPNAFTPNNDGLNDVFRVNAYGLNFSAFKLTIYNRFGEQVFSSDNVDIGWDGRFKGTEQSSSTYVWHCTYQINGNVRKAEKGTLILAR